MKKYETIENFVKRYEKRSKNTVDHYRSWLNQYFTINQKNPDTYFTKPDEDHYKQDITRFWEHIRTQAPKGRDAKLYCVKSFMMWNEIELKTKFYKQLRESEKEKGALTEDYMPTIEDLKTMLHHAHIREQAWILLAVSSGMRIGEIFKLELGEDMLHLDEDPPRIRLPGRITKNGYPRFTFCSHEARDAVQQWLKIRTSYLQKLNGKNNLPFATQVYHDPNDPRVFPFQYSPIANRFNMLTKILGKDQMDKRTQRRHFHIHVLRKFANTRMLLSMPQPMVDYIIGHTTYLSKEYNKFTPDQIAPHYKKAMNDLCVFSSPDYEETHQRIRKLETANLEQQKIIDQLKMEMLEMRIARQEQINGRKNRKTVQPTKK